MFASFQVSPSVGGDGLTGVSLRAKVNGTVIGSQSGCRIVGSAVEDTSNTDGFVDVITGGSPVPGSGAIGILTPTYMWEICYDGTNWISVGSSGPHTMYWTYGAPQAPQAKPWTGTLDIACCAASGCTAEFTAMSDIYSELYYSAGGIYDSNEGRAYYTDDGGSSSFNLTLWLNAHSGAGVGSVNCYDMGKAMVVFSNALGCGASYAFTYPFGYLNCVKPIGKSWANNPFYLNTNYNSNPIVDGAWSIYEGRSGFGNHAFARCSGTYIFDASAGIVDCSTPLDAEPCVEYSLDGFDSWNDSYRVRVIDDSPASSPGTPTGYTFIAY